MTLVLLHSARNPGRKNQPQGLNGMINAQLTDKKLHSDALTFKRSFYISPLLFDSVWSDSTVPVKLLCLALPTHITPPLLVEANLSNVSNLQVQKLRFSLIYFFKSPVYGLVKFCVLYSKLWSKTFPKQFSSKNIWTHLASWLFGTHDSRTSLGEINASNQWQSIFGSCTQTRFDSSGIFSSQSHRFMYDLSTMMCAGFYSTQILRASKSFHVKTKAVKVRRARQRNFFVWRWWEQCINPSKCCYQLYRSRVWRRWSA